MRLHLLAHGQRLAVTARLQLGHVERRRWRRGAQQVLEHPLATLNDRRSVGIGRQRQDAAVSQQASAVGVADRNAPQLRSIDVLHAVVLGQPLIEIGVVGRQHLENAAVLAHDARKEQPGFVAERLSQLLVERKDHRVGLHGLDVAQVQPLPGEIGHEGVRTAILQHPANLPFEHRRIAQPAAGRKVQQVVVRNAAPQEEGEPRRQFDIADAVDGTRCGLGRVLLRAKQELGRGQQRLYGLLNAGLEVAAFSAGAVELHQRLDVVARDRPSKRPAREHGQNRAGARVVLRATDEDLRAAGRHPATGHVERPADHQLADFEAIAGDVEALHAQAVEAHVHGGGHITHKGRGRSQAGPFDFGLGVLAWRGHANGVQAGRDGKTCLERIGIGDLGARLKPAKADLEHIVRIDREIVLNRETGPRVERQVVADALVAHALERIARRAVDLLVGLLRRIADGQPADAARGRQITLDQHGRCRQHGADVVEAVARIVHRQPVAGPDIDGQQVPNGVAVLGAIQPMDGGAAGIGIGRRRLVERRFKKRDHGQRLAARWSDANGGRRHLTRPQLAERLLPDVGALGHAVEPQSLQ